MLKKGIIITLGILIVALGGMFTAQQVFDRAVIEPAGGPSLSSRSDSYENRTETSSRSNIPEHTPADPHPIGTVGGIPLDTRATEAPPDSQAMEISLDPSIPPDTTGNLKPGEAVNRTQRVVIHTAYMKIVVENVPGTMDEIARTADSAGGWLVSSSTDQQESGQISIRIPANLLENTMGAINGMATETQTTSITSEDVTDEYIDLSSRLANDVNTRMALERTMAEMIQPEHILEVQRVLHEVQESIERIKGRLLLIEETATYSLLTVEMSRRPAPMLVELGPDLATTTSDPVILSATFQGPQGADEFTATWNMGDGSPLVAHTGTIPLNEANLRSTATISHRFPTHLNSPYIVTVEIAGEGASGRTAGNDQIKVTVIESPQIIITLEDNQDAYVGDQTELIGYFTRPPSIQAMRIEWDPGDGTPPITMHMNPGENRAVVQHTYLTPSAARAEFRVHAQTVAGEITRSAHKFMYVEQKPGYTAGGINFGKTIRYGTKGLTWSLQAIAIMALWTAIFSPIWAPVATLVWWYRRNHPKPQQRG